MGTITEFFIDQGEYKRLQFPATRETEDGVEVEHPLRGHWLQVRQNLASAERSRLRAGLFTSVRQTETGEEYGVDLSEFDVEYMDAWLKDWSFTDRRGKETRPTRKQIETLAPRVASLTLRLIKDYDEQVNAEDDVERDPKERAETPEDESPTPQADSSDPPS